MELDYTVAPNKLVNDLASTIKQTYPSTTFHFYSYSNSVVAFIPRHELNPHSVLSTLGVTIHYCVEALFMNSPVWQANVEIK